MSLITTLRNPATNEMVWRGCWACLQGRLASPTGTIDYTTRMLLQRCREQIVDSDWHRVEALVADIDAVLRG